MVILLQQLQNFMGFFSNWPTGTTAVFADLLKPRQSIIFYHSIRCYESQQTSSYGYWRFQKMSQTKWYFIII